MSWYKTATPKKIGGGVEIVAWEDGTDEQIVAMLEAHYAGKIDVSDYWNVGDQRLIHVNAMSATGVNESHLAKDYKYTIIDFKHDDLTTPIGEITKAAITVQQEELFCQGNTMDSGYMNFSDYNNGGWDRCKRRTWCNEVYFAALPQYIQDNIKQVNKSSSVGGTSASSTLISIDKAFFLSEVEVINSCIYSVYGEGTQYLYYQTSSNRIKNKNYPYDWWTRSADWSGNNKFCVISYTGDHAERTASSSRGIAPAFCL